MPSDYNTVGAILCHRTKLAKYLQELRDWLQRQQRKFDVEQRVMQKQYYLQQVAFKEQVQAHTALTVTQIEFVAPAMSRTEKRAEEANDLQKRKADLERFASALSLDLKHVYAEANKSTSQRNLVKKRIPHAEELPLCHAVMVPLSQQSALLQLAVEAGPGRGKRVIPELGVS